MAIKVDKKVKGLHLADLHFGINDSQGLYNSLKNQFIPYLMRSKPHFIIIHGDTYDKKISFDDTSGKLALKFLDALLIICKKLKIQVRIIKGTKSHDLTQLDTLRHKMTAFTNFKIINHVEEETISGVKILYVPEEYVNDYEAYYRPYLEKGGYDLICGHGTFDVAGFNGQESEREVSAAPTFKLKEWSDVGKKILFGHIHTHSTYKNLEYIGSFYRWCFGEETPKGFVESIIEDGEVTTNFIVNPEAPEYNTLTLHELNDSVLKSIEERKNKGEMIRVALSKSVSETDEKILNNISKLSDVKIKAPKIELNEQSVEIEYVDDIFENIRRFINAERPELGLTYKDIEEELLEEE